MKRRERGLEFHGFGGNSKHLILVLCTVLAAALAVAVGQQMSTQAMAVVIGLVCGIAASIPTSLLLLVVLAGRDRQQIVGDNQPPRQNSRPPVAVIPRGRYTGGWLQGVKADHWPETQPEPTMDRQFHVVGSDGLTLEG